MLDISVFLAFLLWDEYRCPLFLDSFPPDVSSDPPQAHNDLDLPLSFLLSKCTFWKGADKVIHTKVYVAHKAELVSLQECLHQFQPKEWSSNCGVLVIRSPSRGAPSPPPHSASRLQNNKNVQGLLYVRKAGEKAAWSCGGADVGKERKEFVWVRVK